MNYTTCVSVAAEAPDAMRRDMELALEGSRFVELRLDCLDAQAVEPFLESVSSRLDHAVLTLRSPREGGSFAGTEDERIRLLENAATYGPFLLDVEYGTLLNNPGLRGSLKTDLLVSWHNLKWSATAVRLRRRMVEMGKYSNWVKMVVTAEAGQGAAAILSLYAYRGRTNLVAFAMGDAGRFSRLCSMHLGCPFMYVSLGKPVAPGQYSLDEVRRLSGVM